MKKVIVKKGLQSLALALLVVLSGCAGVSGSFNCNKTAGDTCESISEVNQQANAGVYDHQDSTDAAEGAKPQEKTLAGEKQQLNPVNGGFAVQTPLPGAPVRFQETVQRIWIGPYQDTDHNYHEPSFIYLVLRPSYWVGVPPQAITHS